MIRTCTDDDFATIAEIINEAAKAYQGEVPADCLHDPYMTQEELKNEIALGVDFSCWDEKGVLIGVMGLQKVRDVTLIRHAYVRTSDQSRGIGSSLLTHLIEKSDGPLLVGTWAAARWAIRFYERHGFHLVDSEEKDRLLSTYWNIPVRQRETSVVLTYAADTK